jgi:hypothetical protein
MANVEVFLVFPKFPLILHGVNGSSSIPFQAKFETKKLLSHVITAYRNIVFGDYHSGDSDGDPDQDFNP